MGRGEIEDTNPYAAPESDLAPDAYADSAGALQYASFWQRFVAAFVDGIIYQILVFCVVFALTIGLLAVGLPQEVMGAIAQLFGIVISWLYFALQESSDAQATLGKRMMGLKVVDMSGQQISFGKATGRFFGKILSGLLCLIGYLMQPFTEQKQALHDIMAGTLVIKA